MQRGLVGSEMCIRDRLKREEIFGVVLSDSIKTKAVSVIGLMISKVKMVNDMFKEEDDQKCLTNLINITEDYTPSLDLIKPCTLLMKVLARKWPYFRHSTEKNFLPSLIEILRRNIENDRYFLPEDVIELIISTLGTDAYTNSSQENFDVIYKKYYIILQYDKSSKISGRLKKFIKYTWERILELYEMKDT
eukprot:TRINITY_DN5687_c0_g1_i5.p2 TRINITY_DN5687_c0_g1~~TRINITY_DN5687_c0_g1_i5.p2  ORF type:complete len:191 (+),score=39.75 TRINITY_DN5687_c0_g1_i5:129-701(+)